MDLWVVRVHRVVALGLFRWEFAFDMGRCGISGFPGFCRTLNPKP